MSDSYCGTALHETLESLLHKTLALGIECRGSLVKDKYRRVLEDCTRNAYSLALSAREQTSAVTHVGVIAVLGCHDELMCIGNLGSLDNLLHCSVLDTECYVVVERVVEKDSLLVHVTYEGAQRLHLHVLHVNAVDGYLALLHIIVAWDKVDHSGLTASRLAYESHGLALLYLEVDILEYIALAVV